MLRHGLAQFQRRKPKHRVAPGIVTAQAFGAGEKPPGLFANHSVLAGCRNQSCVGLAVIPAIAVSAPAFAGEMQQLRFNFALIQSVGLSENSVGRKLPMAIAVGDHRIAGQREHAFGNRVVGPQFGPHGKRRYSRREFVIANRSEKPGLAELAGENRWLSGGGISHEAMDRAAIMQKVKLTVVIFGEADDFIGRIGQLAAFRHALAIVPQLPDFPGLVIAINVSAFQLRQSLQVYCLAGLAQLFCCRF